MLVTLSGIVIVVRFLQLRNAYAGISVMLLGKRTVVNFSHSENAPAPILVTLSGIVTLIRFLQL